MDEVLDLSSIPQILNRVRMKAIEAGLEPKAVMQVELAVEELLINALKHGYRGEAGWVELVLIAEPGEQLEIVCRDRAPHFNMLAVPSDYSRDLPLEERPIGGLGLPLIKAFFDEIEYAPLSPGNELRCRRLVL
ncbi:MAG: ATP-binding protein [Chlamydiia bacterium]